MARVEVRQKNSLAPGQPNTCTGREASLGAQEKYLKYLSSESSLPHSAPLPNPRRLLRLKLGHGLSPKGPQYMASSK